MCIWLCQGAFARVTDADLAGRGLWIPRNARIRILALSEAVKRRMMEIAKSNAVTLENVIESSLVESRAIDTKTVQWGTTEEGEIDEEAGPESFVKKADIKKAWEKREKAMRNKVAVVLSDEPKKKDLPESLSRKIARIKR